VRHTHTHTHTQRPEDGRHEKPRGNTCRTLRCKKNDTDIWGRTQVSTKLAKYSIHIKDEGKRVLYYKGKYIFRMHSLKFSCLVFFDIHSYTANRATDVSHRTDRSYCLSYYVKYSTYWQPFRTNFCSIRCQSK
jgi:hypothetical protein